MSEWTADIDKREVRHSSGLVVRFEPHPDGGWSGHAVEGVDHVPPDSAARLMREAGEAWSSRRRGPLSATDYRAALGRLGLVHTDEPWRYLGVSRETHFRYWRRGAPDSIGRLLRLADVLGPTRALKHLTSPARRP